MTCFRVGNFATPGRISGRQQQQPQDPQPQPFVEFSPHQDRASLMSSLSNLSGTSTPRRRRRRATSASSTGRRRRTRVTRLRVVHGRVALRVGGFPGVQHVGASQLVRFVPLNKLRAAARRVLGGTGAGRVRRRRGTKRRRRVGRKKKRRAAGGARRRRRTQRQ